jgi:aerobic carbon-monoxide dehydrogenase medium subunit
MIPPDFEYERPASLDIALALLKERPDDCRPIAGGQSLLPLLKLRLIYPTLIVDLCRIPELAGITIRSDKIAIGAMTTERAVELSPEIRDACPTLVETMSVIADPHIRNLGTIGGSLCFADPRGDIPASMLALDATMTAASTAGTRAIPASEFFTGPFSTALREDELLVAIDVPIKRSATGAYVKLSKRAGDFAVIAVAARVDWGSDGRCRDARIALCAAGPTPILVEGAAHILAGSALNDDKIDETGRFAQGLAGALEDPLVSVEYRSAMIRTMVGKALTLARARARAKGNA